MLKCKQKLLHGYESCGISAARSEHNLQMRTMIRWLALDANMLRMPAGVFRIGVNLSPVIPRAEGIERHVELTGLPIVKASQEPLFSVAARNCDVPPRFPVQHTYLIP